MLWEIYDKEQHDARLQAEQERNKNLDDEIDDEIIEGKQQRPFLFNNFLIIAPCVLGAASAIVTSVMLLSVTSLVVLVNM